MAASRTGSSAPVMMWASILTAFSVSQPTMETTSPLRRLPARARQAAFCMSIAAPSIEPDSSRTRVMFMSGRSALAIFSLLTPIWRVKVSWLSPRRASCGVTTTAPGSARG